jgi:DNA-binding SARP family transcriptional activator/tetratricopeptide (TPR) repeat protein
MKFRILGAPDLSSSGPQPIKLSPQLWGVLASLLMAEGNPVPVDSLVDHLWGWNPPPMATATVRTYVSRINTLLEQDGIRIGHRARGYLLSVDPQLVDLHRFRSFRRQAESVAESGDLGHAAALLRQADDLWRGPLLMGLSAEWVSARRKALDDERHETVKLRIGMELNLGRQASLLGELRELSEHHQFDEEVARDLMISLYRLGRQKDAIQVGREVSERFAEAGLDPSPRLRDVHTRILRGDARLSVTPAYRTSGQARQPNTLPQETLDFGGREEETKWLTAASGGNAPLLEVIGGMAGIGKTTLAVHVAHCMTARYPDAQLFLPFPGDGPGDVAEALHRLLRMLGVAATRIPAGTAERARLWRAELAHRRAVIVLDDVPGPDQAMAVAPTTGDSLTVVTTRQLADWRGRRVLCLEPLSARDSVTLLQRLTGPATDRDTDKMAMVASLCGGLPLALRVTAGRLREGNQADLDGLIEELTEVHAGRADGTETGHRIFSAFEFTYRQLTAESRRMFRLLGASPSADISLDAAAALAGESMESTAGHLEALCERFLLERTSADRFRFHALIWSYAAGRCAREETEAERRHALGRLIQHYSDALNAVASADRDSFRQDAADRPNNYHDRPPVEFESASSAHAWLEAEWRSVLLTARHAAMHEQHRQCADLTHSLAEYLFTGGYWSDAVPAHERALQACRLLDDPTRIARAALDLSAACRRIGDHDKARHNAQEALAAYISLGDQRGQAAALDQLGIICSSLGSARDGLAHHQEAADLYHHAGDQSGMARAVMHTATAFGALGRYMEGTRNFGWALSLFQETSDRRGEAMCLNNLGAVLDFQGLHRDAVAYYEKSIAIFREIGGRQNLALLDHNLGRVQQYKGKFDEAIAIYRKALAEYYTIGDLQHQAIALSDIGTAFVSKECYNEALAHHGKSAELAEAIGDRSQFAAALCGLADAYRGLGSYRIAAENYDKAHRLATEIEAPYISGKALYGMAETLLITQGLGAAKIYWRQAHDIFSQLGVQEATIVELRLHGLGATAS